VPRPPDQTFSKEVIKAGEALYSKHIALTAMRLTRTESGAWTETARFPIYAICRGIAPAMVRDRLAGSHRKYGMPGFGTPPGYPIVIRKMSREEADAIHAYIIDLSWQAYNEDQKRLHSK